ncbi:MAG: histidinol-phosphate transaminase [Polyangiaceae bacterium]|jgi:histidinol-phosphate aminotransferase
MIRADTMRPRELWDRRDWLRCGLLALAELALESCSVHARPAASAAPAVAPRVVHANLDLNENPFGPSPLAVDAIRSALNGLARYTDGEAVDLQRQIAAREGVPVDRVVLGDVLDELGVHLALQGGPGGEFIYSTPGYGALAEAAQSAGGVAVAVRLNDRLENDLPALGARVNAHTRALFVVNPHNPSGTLSDVAALETLVREASTRALVIVDEAYLEFTGEVERRTCVGLVRAGLNVAVFRTFSKCYGLAALPLGYAVVPCALAEMLRRRGVGIPRSLNRLSVVAAAASLRDGAYLAAVREQVTAERARWLSTLRELNLRTCEWHGNFVFFETGRPHREFAAAMLSAGVNIGRSFPPLDGWARISIGLPEENALAQEALRALLR